MRRLVPALAAIMLTAPALASGGLSCDASDETVEIAIQSGITRGMGSPLFQFQGEIEIRNPAVSDTLRKTTFGREHVPQYWIDDKGLKLLLYRETETGPHGYVEIEIITGHDEDELTWDGEYAVTVSDVSDKGPSQPDFFEFSGPISCFVE
jgi:hypothetical protein